MTFGVPRFALGAGVIAALRVDFINIQAGRFFSKDHVTTVVLKVGLHGHGHAQLFSEECLCRSLAQVDTHSDAATLC